MRRAGWISIVVGILVLVGCVLTVNHAAIQHNPHSTFAQRTSYDMAKRSMHATLPRVLPVALLGALLLAGGSWMLRRADQEGAEAVSEPSTDDAA